MVEHQSKEVVDKMSEELKIQPALQLPRKIVDSIQPVFSVNPNREGFAVDAVKSTTGATAVFAVPTTQDFFLTSVALEVTQNVVSDSVKTLVRATMARTGLVEEIVVLNSQTVTKSDAVIVHDFPIALKIMRGTNIELITAFTVGALTAHTQITGYLRDPL